MSLPQISSESLSHEVRRCSTSFTQAHMLTRSSLNRRMIAIFDEDGGGDVDFAEFVSGLSAFSSKGNKEQKLQFAFKVYDIDRDGYISNGELFIVLKMMVGSNLKDQQLQQIVDKTIMEADLDKDGKISFEEFTRMVETTDVSMSMTLGKFTFLGDRRCWGRANAKHRRLLFRSVLVASFHLQIPRYEFAAIFPFSETSRSMGSGKSRWSLDVLFRQSHRNGVE